MISDGEVSFESKLTVEEVLRIRGETLKVPYNRREEWK